MGGLIRRMPITALCFLIGAVAISGLPPLNGFVSEWLTYQALLAGFGTTQSLTRVMFPVAGALLALTAALAAACFVKAFGITFLALPRSEEAGNAHEVAPSMRLGMAMLAAACVVLGLGATWFLPVFDPITQQAMGVRMSSALVAANGVAISAGTARGGTVSTAGMAAMLVLLSAFPALLWLAWGRREPARDRTGVGLRAARPDRRQRIHRHRVFQAAADDLLRALPAPAGDPGGVRCFALSTRPRSASKARSSPLSKSGSTIRSRIGFWRMASRMRAVQAGSIHAYLAYIFVTLILLLLFGVRG